MYLDLYGRKTTTRPSGAHFEKSQDGSWTSRAPSLPINEIMQTMEAINLKFLQAIFDDPEKFWDALSILEFDLVHAGLDPEARGNRDQFNEFLKTASDDGQRIVFYYSVRGHNHAAQNILNHVFVSLGDAYDLLSRENLEERVPLEVQAYDAEHYRSLTSPNCFRIWERFSYCIEKIISFLDFLSKYVAEISEIDGKKISGRLHASSITFGDWKKIKIAKSTALSEISDELRLLIVLRNETVHNGTIDHFSRVYEHAIGDVVKRRFLLMPDHDGGRILTAAGRRRFFQQDNHLNAILPEAIARTLNDALLSLQDIDRRMPNVWPDPSRYFDRHKEVFDTMEAAQRMGAFMKYSPTDK